MDTKRYEGMTKGPWTPQQDETPWTCGDARTAIELGEELGHTEILFSLNNSDDEPLAYLVWEPLADKQRCEELRANARLIADAPELLAENERLRVALQGILEIGKRDMSNPKYDGYFETARLAIKLATERTQQP